MPSCRLSQGESIIQAGGSSDEVGQKERGFPYLLVWLGPKEKGDTVYSLTTKPALGNAVEILDRFGLGDLERVRVLDGTISFFKQHLALGRIGAL